MKNNLSLTVISFMLICSISHGQNVFPATGNVGIGTLSPNYNLDINGTISASQIFIGGNPIQSSPWNLNGSNTYYSTGKVGIGTNDPAHTLDVEGTLNATSILLDGTPINNEPSPWEASDNDLFYATGNIGIGTNNTQGYKLAVAGNVIAEAVKVELQGAWPDFVFEAGYRLPNLSETEAFIKEHGHLPQVPSADEVKVEGIQLGEMDAILLQKIEELTLYAIQQQKEIEDLNAVNEKLIEQNKSIESLTRRLEKLEQGTPEK